MYFQNSIAIAIARSPSVIIAIAAVITSIATLIAAREGVCVLVGHVTSKRGNQSRNALGSRLLPRGPSAIAVRMDHGEPAGPSV